MPPSNDEKGEIPKRTRRERERKRFEGKEKLKGRLLRPVTHSPFTINQWPS